MSPECSFCRGDEGLPATYKVTYVYAKDSESYTGLACAVCADQIEREISEGILVSEVGVVASNG